MEFKTSVTEVVFENHHFILREKINPTSLTWWINSFMYGPSSSSFTDVYFGNKNIISEKELVFYSFKDIPTKISRKGSKIWLYTGTDDPFCYVQVTYTEQFWESYSPLTYCFRHMHDNKCSYITHELQMVESHSLLSARRILHCYGFKGKLSTIRSGNDKNWSQLFTTGPLLFKTIYGEFMFYEKGGTYYWVSPIAAVMAVTYHHERITGMIIERYAWKRINTQRFTLGKSRSLEALMEKVAYYAVKSDSYRNQPYNVTAVSLEKCRCDKVGWVRIDWKTTDNFTTVLGKERLVTSDRSTYLVPTCEFDLPGLKTGDCPVIPVENFLNTTKHGELEFNDEETWYKALLEDFFAMLRTFLGAMVTYVIKRISDSLSSFGWEVIVCFILPYLLLIRTYGNVMAIFISSVCTLFGIYIMDLASEGIDALVG